MASGAARNQSCWCGSGKKFKKCHLLIEQAARQRPDQLEGGLRKRLGRQECMCPPSMRSECTGRIVSAHTISRAASLNALAVDGHVYSYKLSIAGLQRSGGRVVPELVGVRKASTFNGFCSKHDTSIFKVLDVLEDHLSPEFLAKMCFRSISKELFLKRNLLDDERDIRAFEMGRSAYAQRRIRSILSEKNAGMKAAIRELEVLKSKFDSMIEVGCYNGAVHVVIELRGVLPVLISSLFQPERTAAGERIQNLQDMGVLAECVLLGSFPVGSNSCIVLSFLEGASLARKFVESVVALPPEAIAGYFIGLAFEVAENIAISPVWWDGLDKEWREVLTGAWNRGLLFSQSSEVAPLKCVDLPLPTVIADINWIGGS